MKKFAGYTSFLVLLLFFDFLPRFSIAQEMVDTHVSGVILDEKQQPLPFAAIILKALHDSTVIKTALSEIDGKFTLLNVPTGVFMLEITMLGYETYRKEIESVAVARANELGNIQLKPATKNLSAVIITGQKPFIEQRADKIVINLNDQLAGGSSLMEVMDRLPGIQVNPDNMVYLNGRNVRIYIDGKPTPLSADALAGLLRGMSATSIERVELIARPSSKYDASASGGIINIVRKRGSREGLRGNAYGGGGFGRYAKYTGGFNLNFKTGKYNLLLNTDYNFNKYFVDNYILATPAGEPGIVSGGTESMIKSVRQMNNITPSIGLDLYLTKKTTLSFAVTNALQLFKKDAFSEMTNLDEKSLAGNFDNRVKTKMNNFSSGLHLLHQMDTLGKELTVDLDYYQNVNYSDQHNTEGVFSQGRDELRRTFFDQNNAFDVYSAKADLTLPLKHKAQMESGFKSSYVETYNRNVLYDINGSKLIPNDSQSDLYRYSESIHALYTTFHQELKKLSYQLGLRAEGTWNSGRQLQSSQRFSQNYIQLFPTVFFDYKFTDKHSFIVSFDKKTNRPTYENMNPLLRIINANNFVQGNPNLRPVSSYNGSATLAYRNALFVTANFGIDFRDFTYFAFQNQRGDSTVTRPVNNRYTQTVSLITAYNRQIKPWWYTSTNINLRKLSYQLVDDHVNITGITTFNFDTYNSFSLTKQLSWLILFRYRGKSQERNIKTDAYFTLTSGLRQSLLKKRATIALNVTDIFNNFKNRYLQQSLALRQVWENRYETTTVRLNFTYNFGGQINKVKKSDSAADERRRSDTKEN
ncbi:TonB-dependent receptor family protein [Dyadobacter chenwenxiniae]|uniref:TonB-dependent receptor family protein n=1 Tax=Dyadobacter chenwenxiniae TaxID=2906456 RepID=A0A9X1PRE1_9BACT|nr:outer membrane beta-barrel family protein [Dyadobacter chenwenxiniae]MCF0064724.1 TonB-dependent receptor family protein [Dyadobacter chenwenxiniae]UON84222.1 TonB-dependent receptor family protein [Dyadobacter chenwenxiniae]